MAMGVDEPGDNDFAADIDFARAAIGVTDADNPIATNRDIPGAEFSSNKIEHPPAFQNQIRGLDAPSLGDGPGEKSRIGHRGCSWTAIAESRPREPRGKHSRALAWFFGIAAQVC